jgi:hypothetical protein
MVAARIDRARVAFNAEYTYVGEIIYPENRIVVNYDFQGWVPFTIIDTSYWV